MRSGLRIARPGFAANGALPLAVTTAPTARICRFIAPKTRRHRRALKNLEKAMPGNSRGARLPAGDILLEYRPRVETQP
jgi:lauroyl/myristoyl acyltransferase